MKPEVNAATVVLLTLLLGLFVYDWVTAPRGPRRGLILQGVVFAGGALLVLIPGLATALARSVGIGRGVDFVLYPVVIWLVRETLVSRRRRIEDRDRLDLAVRELAIARAREVGEGRSLQQPPGDA